MCEFFIPLERTGKYMNKDEVPIKEQHYGSCIEIPSHGFWSTDQVSGISYLHHSFTAYQFHLFCSNRYSFLYFPTDSCVLTFWRIFQNWCPLLLIHLVSYADMLDAASRNGVAICWISVSTGSQTFPDHWDPECIKVRGTAFTENKPDWLFSLSFVGLGQYGMPLDWSVFPFPASS